MKEPQIFEKNPLEVFRAEIQRIADEEQEEGHFKPMEGETSFSIEELNEEDMELYRKFKQGELKLEGLMEYKKKLDESGKMSQKLLFGYIANKFQSRLMDQR